jgi:hypothetical protein
MIDMTKDFHIDPDALAFLNVLKRGTTIDIHADDVWYVTSTEILDSEPDGQGGLLLTLDATIEAGQLVMSKEMIAGAEHDGDCWCVCQGGLVFRFGLAESEPAFGPDGFFTNNPEALEEHRRHMQEREARREARRTEQEGR